MTDAQEATSVPANSPLGRLYEARWLIAAVAVLTIGAWTVYSVPGLVAGSAFAAFVLIAALFPRPTRSRRLEAVKQRQLQRTWPGTGMKVTVDALPSPCFVADGRGITRYINKAALKAYGDLKPGDPLSFSLRAPSLLEAFDRVCSSGAPERITWTEKVPTEAWFEAHVSPVFMPGTTPAPDRTSRPDFVLVVIQDQSEQRRLERMRTDFVANASHELRTPLASLSGFIETLQGPAKDDASAREKFLLIMQEQAGRMRRLIDDILSLSRIELKAHVKPSGEVDLVDIVCHARDALDPVAREMAVIIETDLPDEGAHVTGDRDELIQVAENLIENALKYGGGGGKITLGVRSVGQGVDTGHWCLSVRDYGEGISAEHLPRLTERFYRVNGDASKAMKGTGLGLAIVKHILNRHRARLEVESTPGDGSVFTVHFPKKT